MPIKDLSTNRPAQFPEIGQLRKGAAKPERGPGRDLDYFRFTSDDGEALAAFNEAYKDKDKPHEVKPRIIRCYLPFDDIDDVFWCFQEHYSASTLKHRCDGETLWQWVNNRLVKTDTPCPDLNRPKGAKDRCKPVGRLKLFIPELERFAYVTALTTSVLDISNIASELQAINNMAGRLTGIPMILTRRPQMVSVPQADGSRQRHKKYMIHIEIDPAFAKAKMIAQHQQALLMAGATQALPTPMQALPAPVQQERIITVDQSTGEIIDDTDHPVAQPTNQPTMVRKPKQSPTVSRNERTIVGGPFPDTNKDTYADMADYHPDYDNDDAEAVIDDEDDPHFDDYQADGSHVKGNNAPFSIVDLDDGPPPAVEQPKTRKKSYTANERATMRGKIKARWELEKKAGQWPPDQELNLDLDSLTADQLIEIGTAQAARLKKLGIEP